MYAVPQSALLPGTRSRTNSIPKLLPSFFLQKLPPVHPEQGRVHRGEERIRTSMGAGVGNTLAARAAQCSMFVC